MSNAKMRNPDLKFVRATAPHHMKARDEQKLEFDANDEATRRATLRRRGIREMARPWAVRGHLMRYRLVFQQVNMLFHQGARIQ